jgi:hypothetical protein
MTMPVPKRRSYARAAIFAACLMVGQVAAAQTRAHAQGPESTPTATPPAPSGMYITVITTEPQVNIRAGPSSAVYPIVGFLLTGATAPALGRSAGGDWIQIEFLGAPNNKGWVYSPLVSVSTGVLPIVEPPPTPVPPATSTIDPTLAAQFSTVPTSTRLATFTPAPPIGRTPFPESEPARRPFPIPLGTLIIGLAASGVAALVVSLVGRR